MANDLDQLMQDSREACADGDRLENFRSALFELKYNIAHIERKYPFLGTELSSMCEDTISRLSCLASAEISTAAMEAARLPALIENEAAVRQDTVPVELPFKVEQTGPPVAEVSHHATNNGSRVAYSLDAAGGVLVKGLDKMGDGIIIAFEKLLSLGPRGKKQPPVMESR